MKKLFLLTIATGLGMCAFAQSYVLPIGGKKQVIRQSVDPVIKSDAGAYANKTTSFTHDTLVLVNLGATDTNAYTYSVNAVSGSTDSGTLFGNNVFDMNGFAERYDFNNTDSAVQVIGVRSIFVGTYNPSSANTVVFKTWSVGAPEVVRSTYSYSGFPNSVLDSVVVPYTQLGIDNSGATDTIITKWFTAPTSYLTTSFFVGFTTNYNWSAMNGDTIAVLVSGQRLNPEYTVTSGDTTINDQNAMHNGVSGSWYDNATNIGVDAEYYLFPVVNTHSTSGVSITNKNFTFMGNYPNPAVSNTNIRFSLATSTDVFIEVTDMNGRVVKNITEKNLSSGEHIVNLSTADMATGDYVYVVRAAVGGGIASKLTVIK